jgi:hypothetical protein
MFEIGAVKWLIDGGWRWALGGLAAIAVGIYLAAWFGHYRRLESDAATVPALKEAVAARDGLIFAMKKADADRAKADSDLSAWQASAADILAQIRKRMKNAPIEINPLCWPSDNDRRVRNDAIDQLLPRAAVTPR